MDFRAAVSLAPFKVLPEDGNPAASHRNRDMEISPSRRLLRALKYRVQSP
jgi:hypothetical protein